MSSTAPQVQTMTAGEERVFSVSFAGKLDTGEKLASVTSVTQHSESIAGADLAFSNAAVSTAVLVLNRVSVAIGEAVQFKATGGVAGTAYMVKIIAVTTSTPPQTVHGYFTVEVTAD